MGRADADRLAVAGASASSQGSESVGRRSPPDSAQQVAFADARDPAGHLSVEELHAVATALSSALDELVAASGSGDLERALLAAPAPKRDPGQAAVDETLGISSGQASESFNAGRMQAAAVPVGRPAADQPAANARMSVDARDSRETASQPVSRSASLLLPTLPIEGIGAARASGDLAAVRHGEAAHREQHPSFEAEDDGTVATEMDGDEALNRAETPVQNEPPVAFLASGEQVQLTLHPKQGPVQGRVSKRSWV